MTVLAVFVASERRKMYQLREAHTLSQMTEQAYVAAMLRTFAGADDQREKLCLGGLGLAGQSGEVADMVKKYLFQGHAIDRAQCLDEPGDVLWYSMLMCHTLGFSLQEGMRCTAGNSGGATPTALQLSAVAIDELLLAHQRRRYGLDHFIREQDTHDCALGPVYACVCGARVFRASFKALIVCSRAEQKEKNAWIAPLYGLPLTG